jgi:hypothetical protein
MSSLALRSNLEPTNQTSLINPTSKTKENYSAASCCSPKTLNKVTAIFGTLIITLAAIALKVFTYPIIAILVGIAGGVVLTTSLLALKVLSSAKNPAKIESGVKSETSTDNSTSETISTSASTTSINSLEAPSKPLKPLSELMKEYNARWDVTKQDYDRGNEIFKFENVKARLDETLKFFNSRFPPRCDYISNFGLVQKLDISPKSKIYVRADLHGDLKSLVENLNELQKQGLLDENFKCAENFRMIFLGDYMDRGYYSLQIAEILAHLKLQNPGNVFLIRGNHETLEQNEQNSYGTPLLPYIRDISSASLLSQFYQNMPLSVLVAEKTELDCDPKHYTLFTHGTFELSTDLDPLLHMKGDNEIVLIPRTRKLSERVAKLCANPAPQLPNAEREKFLKERGTYTFERELFEEETKKYYNQQIYSIQAKITYLEKLKSESKLSGDALEKHLIEHLNAINEITKMETQKNIEETLNAFNRGPQVEEIVRKNLTFKKKKLQNDIEKTLNEYFDLDTVTKNKLQENIEGTFNAFLKALGVDEVTQKNLDKALYTLRRKPNIEEGFKQTLKECLEVTCKELLATPGVDGIALKRNMEASINLALKTLREDLQIDFTAKKKLREDIKETFQAFTAGQELDEKTERKLQASVNEIFNEFDVQTGSELDDDDLNKLQENIKSIFKDFMGVKRTDEATKAKLKINIEECYKVFRAKALQEKWAYVLANEEKLKNLKLELEYLKQDKYCEDSEYRINRLKLQAAAIKIRCLFETEETTPLATAFNWGDIAIKTEKDNRGWNAWALSPEDVNAWLELNSTKPNKICLVFRGHQHLFQQWKHKEKVIITTLPVGMDSPYKNGDYRFRDQVDRAYLIDTDQAVANWKKTALLREGGSSVTTVEGPFPIDSDEV